VEIRVLVGNLWPSQAGWMTCLTRFRWAGCPCYRTQRKHGFADAILENERRCRLLQAQSYAPRSGCYCGPCANRTRDQPVKRIPLKFAEPGDFAGLQPLSVSNIFPTFSQLSRCLIEFAAQNIGRILRHNMRSKTGPALGRCARLSESNRPAADDPLWGP
jgi:hypothetical protein